MPNINPNPKIQKTTTDKPKSAAFLRATLILFLCLERPVSIHMKPACMIKTNIAQSITQRVSTNDLTDSKSIFDISYSSFFFQRK